jgi:hypothetical protein
MEWECQTCFNREPAGYIQTTIVHRKPAKASRWQQFKSWFFEPLCDRDELERAIRLHDEKLSRQSILFGAVVLIMIATLFLVWAAVMP